MNPNDIQAGKEYKGKTPYPRYVLYVSPDRTQVQYDSESVGIGRSYPTLSMERFAKWAVEEIKSEKPESEVKQQ